MRSIKTHVRPIQKLGEDIQILLGLRDEGNDGDEFEDEDGDLVDICVGHGVRAGGMTWHKLYLTVLN